MKPAGYLVRVSPDPNQVILAHGMQVVGESGNFQLTQKLGRGRVAQVDGEERIGLAERNQEGVIAHEAGRVDLFPRGQILQLPDNYEFFAVLP